MRSVDKQLELRLWLWCSRGNVASPEITGNTPFSRDREGGNGEFTLPALDARLVTWTEPAGLDGAPERVYLRMVSFIGGTDIPISLPMLVEKESSGGLADYNYPVARAFTANYHKRVNQLGGYGGVWKDVVMNPGAIELSLKLTHAWVNEEWQPIDGFLQETISRCIQNPRGEIDSFKEIAAMPTHLEQIRSAVRVAQDRIADGADIRTTLPPDSVIHVTRFVGTMDSVDKRYIRQCVTAPGVDRHQCQFRKIDEGWDRHVDQEIRDSRKKSRVKRWVPATSPVAGSRLGGGDNRTPQAARRPVKSREGRVKLDPDESDRVSLEYFDTPEKWKDCAIAPEEEALARMRGECGHDPDLVKEVVVHMKRFYESMNGATKANFSNNKRLRELKNQLGNNLEAKRKGLALPHPMKRAEFLALRFCHPKGELNGKVASLLCALGAADLCCVSLNAAGNPVAGANVLGEDDIRGNCDAARGENPGAAVATQSRQLERLISKVVDDRFNKLEDAVRRVHSSIARMKEDIDILKAASLTNVEPVDKSEAAAMHATDLQNVSGDDVDPDAVNPNIRRLVPAGAIVGGRRRPLQADEDSSQRRPKRSVRGSSYRGGYPRFDGNQGQFGGRQGQFGGRQGQI